MNEIPKDIAKMAEAATNGQHGWLDSARGREAIASAILAERKRCAEVVHSIAKDFYGNTDQMYAAALIASAIEAGT